MGWWKGRLAILLVAMLLLAVTAVASLAAAPAPDPAYVVHWPVMRTPPPAQWARVYADPAWLTNVSGAVAMADGGFILAGQTGYAPWLARVRMDGRIAWQKRLPPLGSGRPDPVALAPSAGDGVVVAHYYPYVDYPHQEPVVLALSADGEILWQKRYGTDPASGYNASGGAYIAATEGGYFLATSRYLASEPDPVEGTWQLWLLRIGETGEVLWQRGYSVGFGGPMAVTSDGGVIIGASSVLRLDSSGMVVWRKSYEGTAGSPICTIGTIVGTADQGAIFAGYSYDHLTGHRAGCLLRLAADGDVAWARRYQLYGGEMFYSVVEAVDGNILVAGVARPDADSYQMDAWLLLLDSTGQVIWAKGYGGPDDEIAMLALPSSDGALIGGMTGSDFVNTDALVLRVDRSGHIDNCDLVHTTPVFVSDRSVEVIDNDYELVSTNAQIDDPGLTPQDTEATMVQLCPGEVAAGVGEAGCRR